MYAAAMASLLLTGILGTLVAVAAKRALDRQWSPQTPSWGQTAVVDDFAASSRRNLRRVTRSTVVRPSQINGSGGIGGGAPDVNAGCPADWPMCSPVFVSVPSTLVAHVYGPAGGGLFADKAVGGAARTHRPRAGLAMGRAVVSIAGGA